LCFERRVDPGGGWFSGRAWRHSDEAFWVGLEGAIEDFLASVINLFGLAVMDLIGRHQTDAGVVMVSIVEADYGTPTGPRSARFFILGMRGLDALFALTALSRRRLAMSFAVAARVTLLAYRKNCRHGCSTGAPALQCGLRRSRRQMLSHCRRCGLC